MTKSEFRNGTSSRKNFCKTCSITILQGGRSGQPFFRQGQKWPYNFCQARIYYFCEKCDVSARNCKFGKFLAQETLF